MFGLKRKKAKAPDDEEGLDEDAADEKQPIVENDKPKAKGKEKDKGKGKDKAADKEAEKDAEQAEDDAEDSSDKAKPEGGKLAGKLGLVLGLALITLIAAGAGAGAGMYLASAIEQNFVDRQKAQAEAEKIKPPVSIKYSGNRVLQKIEPIVTNLASPADTWIRLEAAVIFANGVIKDPQAMAAEIRQDILAYCRTITLDELQGPSALQHLREDLSERVELRTNGAIDEFVIETMVVQ